MTCVLSVAFACIARQIAAEDWPRLRGPRHDGVSTETGLADAWPQDGPPVRWRIDLGQGYSSFAAVNGRLYTQAQSNAAQYVLCLDADTGRELWRRRTNWPWQPDGAWPGPRATPTVAGGKVYFVDAFGLTGCLGASDGRVIWTLNVTEKFRGEGTEFGYSCSPLVLAGKVFLPVGGNGASMVALDAATGAVAWASGDEAASYSPAMPITVGGRLQIAVTLRNVVAAFDPQTGERLWEDRWSEGYDEHSSWLVYREPYLLSCSAFRLGARCLKLTAGADGARAELAWQSKVMSNDVASSIVVGEYVYGFDLRDQQPGGNGPPAGAFKCIELATGNERWSTDRTGHATVIAADGKLILLSETGELILARATPERYEELGRARLFSNETCWTQPVLHDGRLYARAQAQAVCVDLRRDAQGAHVAQAAATARTPYVSEVFRGDSLSVPRPADLLWWYAASMGAWGFAAAAALGVQAFSRRGRAVFYGTLILFGAAGTLVLTPIAGRFVFTWPVTLFAACQLALIAVIGGKAEGPAKRWHSLVAGGFLLAVSGVCFVLCRALFVPAGYGFLTGLALALPATVFAAARIRRACCLGAEVLWTAPAFSVFFWLSALFILWRTRL